LSFTPIKRVKNMAEIFNFGLRGVNSDVKFGKANARITTVLNTFNFRNTADTSFANLNFGSGTGSVVTANTRLEAGNTGGSATNPLIIMNNDLNTGFWAPAADQIGITANGTNLVTIQNPGTTSSSVVFAGTAAITLPVGTLAQRPSAGTAGMLRFNDDDNLVEYYDGTGWNQLGGKSRINDAANLTYVDTDQVADQITMGADDAGVSRVIANWYVDETGANAARLNMKSRQNEFAIAVEGAGTNIDIRLVPKGNGQVFVGESGPSTLSADDGESLTVQGGVNTAGNGGALNLFGGDSTGGNGNGGNIILQAGDANGSGTDGITIVRDANGNDVVRFLSTASAVNYFTVTNSATGNDVVVAAAGSDANVDINVTGKGTGQVVINSGANAFALPNTLGTNGYVLTTNGAGQTSWTQIDVSSTMRVIEVDFDFADAGTNIVTLPVGHRVITMSVYVATAFNQPIELGVTGDTDFWMPANTISQALADAEYVRNIPYNQRNNAANAVRLTTTATAGSGTVTVQYFVP
jgi:hypothetical protein